MVALVLATVLLSGCSGGAAVDARASTAAPPPAPTAAAVKLGTRQQVLVASSFGPGTGDVPAELSVFEVRDRVAPSPAAGPAAGSSHWASADVQICRTRPVALGYPAWVLGDDQGRTAQVSKVLLPQFPQPPLPDAPDLPGCARGWVTFVTPDDLHPTKVTFEQTLSIPGAWRPAA